MKRSADASLVWFELQLCPDEFRIAVVRGQTVLFGYHPEDREKSQTLLLPYEGNEGRVDSLLVSLDALVRSHQIFDMLPNAPGQAFRDEVMETPSIHIRIAYTDGRRWAATYPLEEMPPKVRALLKGSRQLGLDALASLQSEPISAQAALGLVEPESQVTVSQEVDAAIARVKVTRSGQIYLNGVFVSLDQFGEAMDHLKDLVTEVCYYREDPEGEPSPEADRAIKAVLDVVTELRLPIKLSQTDF